jgi:hypothetical protein
VSDETADDLAVFGAPQEVIEYAQRNKEESDFEVWPENISTVRMFLRLSTQWTVGGTGQLVGLNYASVEALFRIYKTKNRQRILSGLQVMETTVLRIVREQQEKD